MPASISRRHALVGVAASTVIASIPARAASGSPASALLDRFAWRLLEFDPAQATTLESMPVPAPICGVGFRTARPPGSRPSSGS